MTNVRSSSQCLTIIGKDNRQQLIHFLHYLQLLLHDSKTKVNARGLGSYTPLHIAAEIDNVDICKRLVRK